MCHFLSDIDYRSILPMSREILSLARYQIGIRGDMISMKEGKHQPPLMVMHFAFRVEDAPTEDARFGRSDRSLPIIILIRDQHMLDVGRMVQHIHGGATL